ncbi:glycosyl hydrolase [uncultured Draconibacterium sp.]|uniref:glycosyl hydrolase n=1 Tax=uncultured Draconibacterium sp. TaxID=1573823 RepID=UPI0032165C03
MKLKNSIVILTIIIAAISCSLNKTKSPTENLYNEFQNPPNSARPRVWWHWMNGNVTKDGIRKDLLWMHRSGIGGFQNFDAGMATPQVVDKRLTFMTPEWKDAFSYTTKLADSLGLEMAIAGSPGWSESGGPWVPAKDGMKKLVWREIRVKGGHAFKGTLPEPYKVTGSFQNIATAVDYTNFTQETPPPPQYYEDIAVVAYRIPANDIAIADLNPKVTSSGGNFTLAQLTDGDLDKTSLLPSNPKNDYAWIQFEFPQAQTIKALTIVGGGTRYQWANQDPSLNRSLEVSNDGINFARVVLIPLGGVAQQTISIPETKAKFFRVTFDNPQASSGIIASLTQTGSTPPGTDVAEIVLHTNFRINHAEEKTGFAAVYDLEKYPTPESGDGVSPNDIIDLTEKVSQDGTLNWDVPAGNWKIVRFGYSLTGKENHPASPEATGLEVDKLDSQAVKDYFTTYLDMYKDATGGLMGNKGLQYIITDSYEAGQMTWTPKMAQEFEKRRGYSLIPWMPVLTGEIIKSTEESEQFLWDWRKTISELFIENHYDQLTDILKEYGMARYSESHENGRQFIGDGMDAKRTAAIPMSAMWTPDGAFMGIGSSIPMAKADIRESASVSHLYGQKFVAAESMTAVGLNEKAWSYCPENLKPTADLELANGLNRFVIHTSVHQPVDDKIPGLGLSIFGQWFTRNETWAGQAKAWTDYLARSSYMLQQGMFVADIVYYYGEDNNITGLFGHQLPLIPEGFNFDFINSDALINMLSVKDGKLVTPSGMEYQILVLDKNTKKMSLSVLRKLATLTNDGAIIVGERPDIKGGLQGEQEEFNSLVDEIWNSGKSNVRENEMMSQVLTSLQIEPDFSYTSENDIELLNVHRKLDDIQFYWVNSRSDQAETVQATFRISGKKPEIWHPETGEKSEVSYSIKDGLTTVSLDLVPNDALFVVFSQPAKENDVELPNTEEKELVRIEGQWDVVFQPERGAPESTIFNELSPWNENENTGIKYFSGTATYTKQFEISESDIASGELYLDLGEVKNLAEVILNGKNLGVLWKKPFRINIIDAVKTGENLLEVKVENLWVNRLIGDLQPEIKKKVTYITMPFYQVNSPLLPSGLLGPVTITTKKIIKPYEINRN